jgi:hypothetical protein
MHLQIDGYFIEQFEIAERAIQFSSKDWQEIDDLFRSVIETNAQRVRRHDLKIQHFANRMHHIPILFQRLDWGRPAPSMQQSPCREQFRLMQFRPRFNKTPLPPWNLARQEIDRVDSKDCHVVLIVGVEMGTLCGAPGSENIRIMIHG